MSINNSKERYIKDANTLEDSAKRYHLEADYKIGTDNIMVTVSHPSLKGKLVFLCTNKPMMLDTKYQKKKGYILMIINDTGMMRLAIKELQDYAGRITV